MNRHIKSKLTKWVFHWWFRYKSLNGYQCEFDFCLGRKKNAEVKNAKVNLGESVLLKLSVKLGATYCTLYFENFIQQSIIDKQIIDGKSRLCYPHSQKTQQTNAKAQSLREMKRGDADFHQFKNVTCCRLYDNS